MIGPIEAYITRVRTRLASRFDATSIDLMLSEIKIHLTESARDLREDGLSGPDSERVAVARFGAPERSSYFVVLANQLGAGDLLWGRIAFGIATFVAVALSALGLTAYGAEAISPGVTGLALASMLFAYGFACAKARSFSLAGPTALAVACAVAIAGVLSPEVAPSLPSDDAEGRTTSSGPRLFAGRSEESPAWPYAANPSIGMAESRSRGGLRLAADTGEAFGTIPNSEFGAPSGGWRDRSIPRTSVQFGVPQFDGSPWILHLRGWVPDSSRLGIAWLLLVLMTNGAVWWITNLGTIQEAGQSCVQ